MRSDKGSRHLMGKATRVHVGNERKKDGHSSEHSHPIELHGHYVSEQSCMSKGVHICARCMPEIVESRLFFSAHHLLVSARLKGGAQPDTKKNLGAAAGCTNRRLCLCFSLSIFFSPFPATQQADDNRPQSQRLRLFSFATSLHRQRFQ